MRLLQFVVPANISLRPALALAAVSLQACATTATGRPAADLAPAPLGAAPFELHNAHVYVRVQVADSTSGWFILDTGGSTMLDSATAAPLGRPFAGTRTGYGGGESEVTVRYSQIALNLERDGDPASRTAKIAAAMHLDPSTVVVNHGCGTTSILAARTL